MYIMGLAHSIYLRENPTHWLESTRMTFLNPLLSESVASFEFESSNEAIHVKVVGDDGMLIASGCFTARGDLDIE
ncbi:hypothetical protein MU1_49980 [Paenibacillus glycanilyticus]|uniref:Dehydrogenase (DH) domain-containing protein n=1 Tax=Paenibacillus glycanilyticus TaxID=126569 RepID=A0ABQ6GM23_9BACL|nr:hypothetical protein MU1_49980 [Paenibacillus glycanilyticus]